MLGFRNIIGEVNFFDANGVFDLEHGTQSIADMWTFWMGMYNFLWVIGEAVFHMLPVGICWSVARKMGTTPILGIILGLTLVSPQLLNGFSAATASAEDIAAHTYDFGFFQIQGTGCQGQVIAALMAAFVLVGLEKFWTKVTPEVVRQIVVPFMSLVPAVFIAHLIVGPIGWAIGNAIADAVQRGLGSNVRVLFAVLFGLLCAPLVMTGLHHMTNAIDTQMVSLYNYTTLWPMIALSNIAQGSAVLAMSVLQKKNERAQQINIPACIPCYLGVTEPALFGVNLKYKFPLVCGMIGSALAAMVCTGFGVQAVSIGVGGIPGILSIVFQFWGIFAVCMATAIVVAFALTYFVGLKKLSAEDRGLVAFESANAVAGEAAEPAADTVVAPADAAVTVPMPASNHATSLTLDNGMELLIHVGIDTVAMGGDGLTCTVKQGNRVRAGQKLLTFSQEKIRAVGHPTDVAFVVSAPGSAKAIAFTTDIDAQAGETSVVSYGA